MIIAAALVCGSVASGILFALRPLLFRLYGAAPVVARHAGLYFTFRVAAVPAQCVASATTGCLGGYRRVHAATALNVARAVAEARATHGEESLREAIYELGELFIKFAPKLQMYSAFVSTYTDRLGLLKRLGQKSKKWNKYLARARSVPQCRKLSLSSFLIMPVQRIPRYKMLLHELAKRTPREHPDAADVDIHNVVIASCTGGSISDLRAAADVLRGQKIRDGVRVTVTPSSEVVAKEAAVLALRAHADERQRTVRSSRCQHARLRLDDVVGAERQTPINTRRPGAAVGVCGRRALSRVLQPQLRLVQRLADVAACSLCDCDEIAQWHVNSLREADHRYQLGHRRHVRAIELDGPHHAGWQT